MVYFSNTLVVSGINNNECTISATEYRTSSILESESEAGQECQGEEGTRNAKESFSRCLRQMKSDAMSLIEMLHLTVHFPRIRS